MCHFLLFINEPFPTLENLPVLYQRDQLGRELLRQEIQVYIHRIRPDRIPSAGQECGKYRSLPLILTFSVLQARTSENLSSCNRSLFQTCWVLLSSAKCLTATSNESASISSNVSKELFSLCFTDYSCRKNESYSVFKFETKDWEILAGSSYPGDLVIV